MSSQNTFKGIDLATLLDTKLVSLEELKISIKTVPQKAEEPDNVENWANFEICFERFNEIVN